MSLEQGPRPGFKKEAAKDEVTLSRRNVLKGLAAFAGVAAVGGIALHDTLTTDNHPEKGPVHEGVGTITKKFMRPEHDAVLDTLQLGHPEYAAMPRATKYYVEVSVGDQVGEIEISEDAYDRLSENHSVHIKYTDKPGGGIEVGKLE